MLKVLSNENVKLKKAQSSLTNVNIYDLETYIKDRAVPYLSCIH